MIQGTTPTIRLTFPFDARFIEKAEMPLYTYAENDHPIEPMLDSPEEP